MATSLGALCASVNELKLDNIVLLPRNAKTKELLKLFGGGAIKAPLPCKTRNVCRFAGGSHPRASVGVLMHDKSFIHPAGSIPRCLRRIRIENVFASGSF